MNMMYDNEGGRVHRWSYKYNSLLNWGPAILIVNALRINASYARNSQWYLNGIISDANVGEADVALDKVAWLYNPDEVTDAYN
jgi:hypothetical protein